MSIVSAAEQSAVAHAVGNATIEKAYFLLRTDREAVRAAHWNGLPEQTRKYICHMAGVGAAKGALPLRNLNALERGKVNRMAYSLIRDLEKLMKCCQGGEMPMPVSMA